MTKVIYNPKFPAFDRDEFLTPFDRMFDQIVSTQFPEIEKQIGVKPFKGTAYPKINVYEWDTKVGVIAELYLEKRGSRNVALARINEIVKSKSNLSLLGRQKEVLVVSLHVLSKVNNQNEELSV